MKKIVLIKIGTHLIPATNHDIEILDFIANGESINADIRIKKSRSLKMHRLYWALIDLVLDYWNLNTRLITKSENDFMIDLEAFVTSTGVDCGPIRQLLSLYSQNLSERRTRAFEPIYKDSEMLHQWIKEQVGLYDLYMTPDGLVKKTKSISFDSMSHNDWMQFYQQAFGVAWNLVLSQIFESESQAHEAIERLSKMN